MLRTDELRAVNPRHDEPGLDRGVQRRRGRHDDLLEPIDTRVAVVLGVVAVACTALVQLLYPDAAEPQAAQAWYVVLVDTAYWGLACAAVVGLAMRQRYGVVATYWNAVTLVAAIVACPVTGHHTFGVWWLGQASAALVLAGAAAAALRLTRPARSPAAPR